MIAIQNIGEHDHIGHLGWYNYRLSINGREIVRFVHCRPDGLSVCLQRAAEAVKAADVLACGVLD